jgi:hypothetical protein
VNHPGGTGDSLSGQCRGSLQCLLGGTTRTTLGVLPSGGQSNALSISLRFLMKSLGILHVSVLFACCQLSRETARLPTGLNRCVSSLSFFHLSLSLCSFTPRCSLPCSRSHVDFSLNSLLTSSLAHRHLYKTFIKCALCRAPHPPYFFHLLHLCTRLRASALSSLASALTLLTLLTTSHRIAQALNDTTANPGLTGRFDVLAIAPYFGNSVRCTQSYN